MTDKPPAVPTNAFVNASRLPADEAVLVQVVGPAASDNPLVLAQQIMHDARRAVAARGGNHSGSSETTTLSPLPSVV